MTMGQVMVEFGVEDETDAIDDIKLEKQVTMLVRLADLLGITPPKLKEMGAHAIAEVALRQLGKKFEARHITPALSQPEFK